MPDTISLLHLPPCCPGLNPVEDVWQYLQQNHLSHRVLPGYDDIVDACCNAWNALMDMPERIKSIASRTWT